jgi:glycerol kinase
MADFIGAFDQSLTGTRFMTFDHDGVEFAGCELVNPQIRSGPGWVEQSATQIFQSAQEAMAVTLSSVGLSRSDLAAIGVTNQIETTVLWNRRTGLPYCNAIGWQDTRTEQLAAALRRDGKDEAIYRKSGLVPNPHFSATKIQWILENVDGVRQDAERGDVLFGTIDCWLVWNLTGGTAGGRHVTDVTNASRTMLMDLHSLDWDDELLSFFDVPRGMLPAILPSAGHDGFGTAMVGARRAGAPVTGILGEPQAAAAGHRCFGVGEAWCNCEDRNLVQFNVGREPVRSESGLVTTVAYQFGGQDAMYALEGRIPFTGGAIRWVAEALGALPSVGDVIAAADQVADAGGLYFVPAFTGLDAPDRIPEARGVIVGLEPWHTRNHLARAAGDSIAYRMCDLLEAMQRDSGLQLKLLRMDGTGAQAAGYAQLQANLLGARVSRGTATGQAAGRGAAYIAGLAAGYWRDISELPGRDDGHHWSPQWMEKQRRAAHGQWRRAVDRTHDRV